MKLLRPLIRRVLPLVALAAACAPAAAQTYPTKPVRVVVPTTSGSTSDVIIREVTQKLAEVWGQQIVIDNRPGGGVLIGTEIVAKAPPDGHTLLFTYTDHVYYPSYHAKMPYDAIGDFAPITTLATVPLILVVHPSVPATSVPELVSVLKAAPGKYNFGSAGSGSSLHLAGELFKAMTGTDMVHVPYRGGAQAYADLFAGQIQVFFPTPLSALGHMKNNAVRGLAVTSRTRLPQAPDLPTVEEAGVPGYSAAIWYGVMAPAGTPKPLVDKLNADFIAAARSPKVREKLESGGAIVETRTPEAFSELLNKDFDKWAKVIKAADIRLD